MEYASYRSQQRNQNLPVSAMVIVCVIVAALALFASWSNHRDAEMNAAYTSYEKCVQTEYHMSPSSYYQQFGVSPTCGK